MDVFMLKNCTTPPPDTTKATIRVRVKSYFFSTNYFLEI